SASAAARTSASAEATAKSAARRSRRNRSVEARREIFPADRASLRGIELIEPRRRQRVDFLAAQLLVAICVALRHDQVRGCHRVRAAARSANARAISVIRIARRVDAGDTLAIIH